MFEWCLGMLTGDLRVRSVVVRFQKFVHSRDRNILDLLGDVQLLYRWHRRNLGEQRKSGSIASADDGAQVGLGRVARNGVGDGGRRTEGKEGKDREREKEQAE